MMGERSWIDESIEGMQPVYVALLTVVHDRDAEFSLARVVVHLNHQHFLMDIEPGPQLSC